MPYTDAAAAKKLLDARPNADSIVTALKNLAIETPSWGYADTGTRFGKFHQPACARTMRPVAVTLNRFLQLDFVFILGISVSFEVTLERATRHATSAGRAA